MTLKTISLQEIIYSWEQDSWNKSLQTYIEDKKREWYIIKDNPLFEDYWASINNILSDEELVKLVQHYQQKCLNHQQNIECKNILQRIINSLMILIISEALSIAKYWDPILRDLISAGVLSLNTSIERFNPNKNVKFSTYAVWRMRNFMYKELYKLVKVVDVPSWVITKVKEIEKILYEYEYSNNWQQFTNTHNVLLENNINITKKTLDWIANSRWILSLDAIVTEDSKDTLSDLLITQEDTAEKQVNLKYVSKVLKEYINTLNERDRKIIIYRFWLFNTSRKTLKDIANELNLSSERVRQLQEKLLQDMKNFLVRVWLRVEDILYY